MPGGPRLKCPWSCLSPCTPIPTEASTEGSKNPDRNVESASSRLNNSVPTAPTTRPPAIVMRFPIRAAGTVLPRAPRTTPNQNGRNAVAAFSGL